MKYNSSSGLSTAINNPKAMNSLRERGLFYATSQLEVDPLGPGREVVFGAYHFLLQYYLLSSPFETWVLATNRARRACNDLKLHFKFYTPPPLIFLH